MLMKKVDDYLALRRAAGYALVSLRQRCENRV